MRIIARYVALAIIATMVVAARPASAAGTEDDFKAAYAAAEAANKEAAKLHNQWTVSAAALVAAKKAADAGNLDQAIKSAKESETLAKASIFQSNEQKDAWKDAEIR